MGSITSRQVEFMAMLVFASQHGFAFKMAGIDPVGVSPEADDSRWFAVGGEPAAFRNHVFENQTVFLKLPFVPGLA
jgi:hypothetical protein